MRTLRPLIAGGALLGAAVLLTGCLDAGFPGPTPSTSPRATVAPTASPSPTTPAATPDPAAQEGARPVELDCVVLLPVDGVYDIDPNLTVLPLADAPGTPLAQEAAAADGTVCQVTHGTSGATATISVSAPGATAIAAQREAAGLGAPLGSSGIEAHGSPDALQIFRDGHRITGERDSAFNPDSLERLLALALANGA